MKQARKDLILNRARAVSSKRLAQKIALKFARDLCDADNRVRLLKHLCEARMLAPFVVKN